MEQFMEMPEMEEGVMAVKPSKMESTVDVKP